MKCKNCEQKDVHLIWIKDGYSIYLCNNCVHKFVYPNPTNKQLRKVYENLDYIQNCVTKDSLSIFRIVRTQSEIDVIAKLRPGGNFLDCGSGDGMAVYYAQKAGMFATGVEMSGFSSKKSSERYDIRVYNIDLIKYSCDFKFDVIRMKSFIEHLADPILYLKKAYDLLKENRILIITTENYHSVDAQKYDVNWK